MSDNTKPETERQKLYRAAISCEHLIDRESIVLYRDPELHGNALSQLADRLDACVNARNAKLEAMLSSAGGVGDAIKPAHVAQAEAVGIVSHAVTNDVIWRTWPKDLPDGTKLCIQPTQDADSRDGEILEMLDGITNSNWRTWQELASADEFERWVKARTRHAAEKIRAAIQKRAT